MVYIGIHYSLSAYPCLQSIRSRWGVTKEHRRDYVEQSHTCIFQPYVWAKSSQYFRLSMNMINVLCSLTYHFTLIFEFFLIGIWIIFANKWESLPVSYHTDFYSEKGSKDQRSSSLKQERTWIFSAHEFLASIDIHSQHILPNIEVKNPISMWIPTETIDDF